MRAILDTSAYSAFGRGHAGVGARLRALDQMFLTPVVLGELYAGFLGGSRREENERQLERFLAVSRVVILPLIEDTARRFSVILHDLRSRGVAIPSNDIWIAASAMERGLPVLTMDAHFLKIPQIMVQHVPLNS